MNTIKSNDIFYSTNVYIDSKVYNFKFLFLNLTVDEIDNNTMNMVWYLYEFN